MGVASFSAAGPLAKRIWPNFDAIDKNGYSRAWEATKALNSKLPTNSQITLDGDIIRQKKIPTAIDASIATNFKKRLTKNQDQGFLAVVECNKLPMASRWLTACPRDEERSVEAYLFRYILQRRIRCPVQDAHRDCPLCNHKMDKWGDHALVCPSCGDRTVRHNQTRDLITEEATEAGLAPEIEKAGLLPGRSVDDGAPMPPVKVAGTDALRRPADI